MNDLDLAKTLFAAARGRSDGASALQTQSVYATATSDSDGGTVMVDFGGDAVGDPLDDGETQSIECSTSWAVKRGDTVLVQLVGAQGTARKPIVVAVRGRGDEQDGRISEAEELAQAAIQAVDVEYALGDSQTTAPTTGWATTAPEWEDGKYMWQRTKTTTASGSSYSDATCIQGAAGADGADGAAGATGRGISAIVEQYYLSTSSTTQTGGSWSTAQPEWAEGKHIWTRSKITWTNPSGTSYTTPVLAKAINGANETAAATSYYFFVDSEGAHVTTAQGDATTGQNILIDSSGMHIRNGTTELAYFEAGEIGLGMDSTSASIVLCGNQANRISYDSTSGQLCIRSMEGVRLDFFDKQSGWNDYGFGFVVLNGKPTIYGNAMAMSIYAADCSFFNGTYQTQISGDQINGFNNGSAAPLHLQYSGGADVRVGYGASANLRVNGNIYYAKTHGVTPVYCAYNPNSGEHYFTPTVSEYNSLVRAGWTGQGIYWYAFSN